jgi:hypothetical protein
MAWRWDTVLLYSPGSSCCQLHAAYTRLTRPLCSSRITSLLRSYGSLRPSARHRDARLVVAAPGASPLASERLVPAVPHESPDQMHAAYTPAAACPVPRGPTGSSQERETPLVLTTTLLAYDQSNGGALVVVSPLPPCPRYVLGV